MRRLHLPKFSYGFAMATLGFAALGVDEVAAQEAAHIGEIKFGAYSTCPLGWVEANGQTLPIQGNELLFSVIGTAYGGDGETTFAVPNVQGVVSVPVLLTPTSSAQGIQQQEIKRQPIRRQKITRHDVKEETAAEEPAAGSPTGTPLLACIALVGVLPTDPAAAPPIEEPPIEEPPIEEPPVEEPGGEEPPA